jgi:hypothetical protein
LEKKSKPAIASHAPGAKGLHYSSSIIPPQKLQYMVPSKSGGTFTLEHTFAHLNSFNALVVAIIVAGQNTFMPLA